MTNGLSTKGNYQSQAGLKSIIPQRRVSGARVFTSRNEPPGCKFALLSRRARRSRAMPGSLKVSHRDQPILLELRTRT